MRPYVGRFGNSATKQRVQSWVERQRVGGNPIGVYGQATSLTSSSKRPLGRATATTPYW